MNTFSDRHMLQSPLQGGGGSPSSGGVGEAAPIIDRTRFRANVKLEQYTAPARIEADGYSAIRLDNVGTTEAWLNNTLRLVPGRPFALDLGPHVAIDETFFISFADGADTRANAVQATLVYYREE